LESILAEEGQAEIICEFCSEKYSYNAKDLQNLLLSLKEKSN
jgi:redox-regulated HSP33 family molecular chaperone